MNKHDDNDLDDDLRTAWRAAKDERTPQWLDSKVLRRAAGAASGRWQLPTAWVQPVAFAATLVIGAGVVFNLLAPLQTSGDPAPGASALNDADVSKPEQTHAVAAPAERLQDGEAVRQRFEESAGDAARALRGAAASAPANLAAGREAAGKPRSAQGASSDDERSACNEADRSSAETWWRCTQALFESGDEQAARHELDLLRELHPGFSPPD